MQPLTSPEIDKESLAYKYGDPWTGLGACNVREGSAAPTPALASATLEFSLQTPNSPVMLSVGLPITSADDWEFTDPQAVYPILTPNIYTWKLKLVDAAGVSQTFMDGTLVVS